jgi:hypothetical protein
MFDGLGETSEGVEVWFVLSDRADYHIEGVCRHADVIFVSWGNRLAGLMVGDAVFRVHQELVISCGRRSDGWPVVGTGFDPLLVVFDTLEVRLSGQRRVDHVVR